MEHVKQTQIDTEPPNKDAEKKQKLGEDIAYTINHAVSCLGVDTFGASPAAGWFFDRKINVGCGHKFGWWMAGEFIGDTAAVIPTFALQRYTPFMFESLQKVLKPTVGWAFRPGAERGARKWADAQGLEKDSDAYNAAYNNRVEELYNYEVDHLPHAAIWTAFSTGLTGTAMNMFPESHAENCLHDHHHRHKTLGGNLKAALAGKLTSGALLLTLRAIFPEDARKWDRWASDTIYSPVTRNVSGWFNVDSSTIDKVIDEKSRFIDGTDSLRGVSKSTEGLVHLDKESQQPQNSIITPSATERVVVGETRIKAA